MSLSWRHGGPCCAAARFAIASRLVTLVGQTRISGNDFGSDDVKVTPLAPAMGTMLQAIELPPIGGDTLFANQHLAWERLSDGLKDVLAGLRVVCVANKSKAAATRTARIAEQGKIANADAMKAIHPVVRTHPETGRKALHVSPGHAVCFEGWTPEESAGLLEFLFRHQISPEFQCRLSRSVGDIAIWDNRSALHYPLNDCHGHRRLLHRITLKGDRPV